MNSANVIRSFSELGDGCRRIRPVVYSFADRTSAKEDKLSRRYTAYYDNDSRPHVMDIVEKLRRSCFLCVTKQKSLGNANRK